MKESIAQREALFERVLRSDYYRYEEVAATVRGERYRVATKMGLPAWPRIDYGEELLAETLAFAPDSRVAVLGAGHGLTAVVAAARATRGEVVVADPHYVAIQAAQHTVDWNEARQVQLLHTDEIEALESAPFDVVLIHLPKGKDVVQRWFLWAHRLLAPGGRVYLTGANPAGIKGYSGLLERFFGNMEIVAYRKGRRVVSATKRDPIPELLAQQIPAETEQRLTIRARGESYRVCTRPGIFSWKALDSGTAALLEAMPVGAADRVLDLGCGYGILGLVAARLAPQGAVSLVDANIAAVRASRATLAENGAQNATALACVEVHASDVISAVRDQQFDLVLTNPPFHAGVEAEFVTPLAFIVGSAEVLRPGGKLYLVANRFIKYEPYLARCFATVQLLYQDNHFKVLEATKKD